MEQLSLGKRWVAQLSANKKAERKKKRRKKKLFEELIISKGNELESTFRLFIFYYKTYVSIIDGKCLF